MSNSFDNIGMDIDEENELCLTCDGTGESLHSPDHPCYKCKGSGVNK